MAKWGQYIFWWGKFFQRCEVIIIEWLPPDRIPEKTSNFASLTRQKPLTVLITTNHGKFLEMGIPDHLTCLLRNVYIGKEARVRTRHRITAGSKLGKEYLRAVYCHPAYLYAKYIMQNAGLDIWQARMKISERDINNLRYADDTTLMSGSGEELKSLLKVK